MAQTFAPATTLVDVASSNSATIYQAVAILVGVICTILSTFYANYQNWKTHQKVDDVHKTTKDEVIPLVREASGKLPKTSLDGTNTNREPLTTSDTGKA